MPLSVYKKKITKTTYTKLRQPSRCQHTLLSSLPSILAPCNVLLLKEFTQKQTEKPFRKSRLPRLETRPNEFRWLVLKPVRALRNRTIILSPRDSIRVPRILHTSLRRLEHPYLRSLSWRWFHPSPDLPSTSASSRPTEPSRLPFRNVGMSRNSLLEMQKSKGTTSAVKHLPASKTVSLPSKPSPVVTSSTRASSTRPSLMRPSKDRTSPPFPVVSKRRASNVVSTNLVVNSNTTYRLLETLSRVSNGSPLLPSGEKPSSPVAGEAKRTVEPKGELSRSPKFHERSAERSTRIRRLVSERVPTILLSDEAGEKRRIYDAVVNIQ